MIRPATRDDKQEAAVLIYDAILDIGEVLTGETDRVKVLEEMEHYFSQEVNRLSYRNCLVKELDGKAVGIVITYHGKDADKLDEPIRKYLRQKTGTEPLIDKEADETDFYIDTVSVSKDYRNRQIGTELLQAAIEEGKNRGYENISLLVEQNNVKARQLYERLGFTYSKTINVYGHLYDYLILKNF